MKKKTYIQVEVVMKHFITDKHAMNNLKNVNCFHPLANSPEVDFYVFNEAKQLECFNNIILYGNQICSAPDITSRMIP